MRQDIDPAIWHRDHDIRAAEAERRQELHAAIDIGQRLADQILPGQSDMHTAGLQLVHDFRGREERHLDAVEPRHDAPIAAVVPGLAHSETGALEQRGGGLLETPLGGDGDAELRGHHDSPLTQASSRSV